MRAQEHPALNHRLDVLCRVLEADCRDVMQRFFEGRRQERRERA